MASRCRVIVCPKAVFIIKISLAARSPPDRALNSILTEKLDLAGYFLIVWDIVRFCREQNILAQGRGSAANSAVCYSLGITAVDPVGMELLVRALPLRRARRMA